MGESTEQTAPVVDQVANPIDQVPEPTAAQTAQNDTADNTKTDAANPVDQEESTTATPAVDTPNTEYLIANDSDPNSKKVTLADLSAKGTALYAHKKYEEAAEVFSRASILQAEINGETSPENAEILFHYGRSLFKVGQSKSDVLGGPATAEKRTKTDDASGKPNKPIQSQADKVTQEGVAIVAEQKDGDKKEEEATKDDADTKKPLFQFTGDENFDESDDDEVVSVLV